MGISYTNNTMDQDEELIDIGSDDDKSISHPIATIVEGYSEEIPQEQEQIEWQIPAAADNDMDDESRKLIEQMLAEEEYYYGKDTISTLKKQSSPKKKKRADDDYQFDDSSSSTATHNRHSHSHKKSKKEGLHMSSSKALPSHHTRWTEEENEMLKKAVANHGYGNWKVISEEIKTRNPLQCKNHARHLHQYGHLEIPSKPASIPIVPDIAPSSSNNKEKEVEEEEEDIDLDMDNEHSVKQDIPKETSNIDSSAALSSVTPPNTNTTTMTTAALLSSATTDKDSPQTPPPPTAAVTAASATPEPSTATSEPLIVTSEPPIVISEPPTEVSEPPTEVSEPPIVMPEPPIVMPEASTAMSKPPTTVSEVSKPPTAASESPAILTEPQEKTDISQPPSNDTPLYFPPTEITQREREALPEYFRNSRGKTPERYLKIRNHMLACWAQCKPRYLTKTGGRKGLKDCGDVNAIGRVHGYLESIGAINVGCEDDHSQWRKRSRYTSEDDGEEVDFTEAADMVVNYGGPRKRKVRNERGEWVDPKELEGRVIEHGQVIVRLDSKPKRVAKRLSHHYYGGDDFGRGYDPFRLVPTEHYSEETPPPFEVEIVSDALLVMDFHSHLAHTEIIGLLGGNFTTRDDQKILEVKSVFPCKSTSTGIQCEMDPASEMQAREVFAEKGFNVVGWYHSHPTFEPHPSIRDIENQTSYQTLFREEKTGDEPFIGVIVTPYDPEIQSEHSQIQYLHISKEWNELHSFRVPYACRRTVIQSEQVSADILHQLTALVQEYKDYEHKVNMTLPFGNQTRLDKLLDSLRAHIFTSNEDQHVFIESVKQVIQDGFV